MFLAALLVSFLLPLLSFIVGQYILKKLLESIHTNNFERNMNLFFIIRFVVLLALSFAFLPFLRDYILIYFVSLFIFYYVFKIIEIVKINKIYNSRN